MLRVSPCEYYIKYLVTHPGKYSNDQVREHLEELRLIFISNSHLDRIRRKTKPPPDFSPTNRTHRKSAEYITRLGIRSLYFPCKDMDQATALLEKPRIREFVESMLLLDMRLHEIAAAASQRFGEEVSHRAINYFKYYYWNVDLLTSSEMRQAVYFQLGEASRHPEESGQEKYEKAASYLDPRKIAVDMPASPFSAAMANMRMGIIPRSLNVNKVTSRIIEHILLRSMEAVMIGGPAGTRSLMQLSVALKNFTEVHDAMATPEESIRKEISKLSLRTSDESPKMILELGGEFSSGYELTEGERREFRYGVQGKESQSGDDQEED